MKKVGNYLLVALLTLTCLFLPKQNVSAVNGHSDYITVSNVTSSTAKVDWSGMKDYVEGHNPDGVCTNLTYTIELGDRVLATGTQATGATLSNLTPNVYYQISVTCDYTYTEYYDDSDMDPYVYEGSLMEWESFSTGEIHDVDGGGGNPGAGTQTPSNPSVPNTPQTQKVVLKKPVIQSMRLVNGNLSVVAGNVDTKYTEKLEWTIYDKKTNQLVKTDNSYSVADTIYGLNAKKVYYVKCRAVGSDANYNDVYSEWSDVKYIVSQPKVTSKNKDVKKSQVTIKWKKIPGVKNYTVYVKKGKTKKWTKVKTTKSNKYVLKKFKGKKVNTFKNRYYFAVVANAKVNGKTLSSSKDEFYEAYSYYY